MKYIDRKYLILDGDKMRIIAVGRKILRGSCKRCGACCERLGCEHLKYEMIDGKRQAVCSVYFNRPVRCAIWPLPGDPIPEGCGFYYEDIED